MLVAAPFHNLGIWTDATFDYPEPSARLAARYLTRVGRDDLEAVVRALITVHHKLGRYLSVDADSVERYRRADWIDVSLGPVRFGLPKAFIRSVQRAFPEAGFHRRQAWLAAHQFIRTPWRPLDQLVSASLLIAAATPAP